MYFEGRGTWHKIFVLLAVLWYISLTIEAADIGFQGTARFRVIYAPDLEDNLEAFNRFTLKTRIIGAPITLVTNTTISNEYFYNQPRKYNLFFTHVGASIKTSFLSNPFTLGIGRPYDHGLNPYLYTTGGYSRNPTTQTIRVDKLTLGSFSAKGFLTWKGNMFSPVCGLEITSSSNKDITKFSFVSSQIKTHWTAPFPDKKELSSLLEFTRELPFGMVNGLLGSFHKDDIIDNESAGNIKQLRVWLRKIYGLELDIICRDYSPVFNPTYRDKTNRHVFGYSWVANQQVRWNPIDQYYGQRGLYIFSSTMIPGLGKLIFNSEYYLEQDAYRDLTFIQKLNDTKSIKLDGSYKRHRFSFVYNHKISILEPETKLWGETSSSELLFSVWKQTLIGNTNNTVKLTQYKGNGIDKTLDGLTNINYGWESILDINVSSTVIRGFLQGAKFLFGFSIYDRDFGNLDSGKLLYNYFGYEQTLKGGLNVQARISFPNIDEKKYQGISLPLIGFYELKEAQLVEISGEDTRVFDNCFIISYTLPF